MAQGNEWDSIAYEKVTVSGIRMGDSAVRMTSRFGKPDTIMVEVNEFEGTEYFVYVYGNSRFFIADNKVTGFHLIDASYTFEGSKPIKVGDPDTLVRTLFRNSSNSHFPGEDNEVIVKVRIGSSDSFILFASKAGRIIEIKTWDDL